MRDSFKAIKFEIETNGIATVTLNRPEKLNAMNVEMRSEFKVLSDELISNDQIKVIVFTGAGRAFSAGGDIDFLDNNWKTPEFRRETQGFTNFFDTLETL